MREKVSAIAFLVILIFVAVFCWEVFHKLFIQPNTQFSNTEIGRAHV